MAGKNYLSVCAKGFDSLLSCADRQWEKFLIAYSVLCFVSSLSSFSFILSFSAHECGKAAGLPCVALLVVLLAFFVILIFAWKKNPERIFLLIAIPAGISFAMFILPDQIPDERWHIYRAFDLKISGAETMVPAVLAEMPTNYVGLHDALARQVDWGETAWMDRDLTGYYVHLYLLSSAVIHFCGAVGVNPYIAIIAGRVANGLLFSLAGYWIVKKIPIAKVLVAIYLLNPMLIQQEFSISADSVVNIIALTYIAFVLYLKFKDHISKKSLVYLGVLLLLTCLSKFAYAPLVLLLLLLVPRLRSGRARRVIYVSTTLVVVAGVALAVALYNGETYASMFQLVRNPKELAVVLANSTYELGPLWIKEFAGMILGALNITVWEPCFWAFCLVLLFSAVFNLGESNAFSRCEKVFLVVLTAIMSVAILLVFREWTLTVDMRSDVIMGMQGRYLLPFYILPLFALVTPRASQVRENCMVLYGGILSLVYLFDMWFVVSTFLF